MALVSRAERKRRRCVALERLNSGMGVSEVNRTLVRDYGITRKELRLDTLEAVNINLIQKLASARSKSSTPEPTNTKASFTVGNWALPYLNLLKRTGILK